MKICNAVPDFWKPHSLRGAQNFQWVCYAQSFGNSGMWQGINWDQFAGQSVNSARQQKMQQFVVVTSVGVKCPNQPGALCLWGMKKRTFRDNFWPGTLCSLSVPETIQHHHNMPVALLFLSALYPEKVFFPYSNSIDCRRLAVTPLPNLLQEFQSKPSMSVT